MTVSAYFDLDASKVGTFNWEKGSKLLLFIAEKFGSGANPTKLFHTKRQIWKLVPIWNYNVKSLRGK